MASKLDVFVRRRRKTGQEPGVHARSNKYFIIYLECMVRQRMLCSGGTQIRREGKREMYQGKEKLWLKKKLLSFF